MRMLSFSLVFITLFFSFSILEAQTIPEGGERILPENPVSKLYVNNSYARSKLVDVTDMPFTKAVEAETYREANNTWDAQFNIRITKPVNKNDVLLAIFYAKGIESSRETGEVQTEFIFERDSDPWTKSASYPVIVVGAWKQFFVPFQCVENYSTGQASVKFRLGYLPQTIQIGGLEVLNYKNQYTLDDLPRTSISYAGMEPDAPWRAQAEQMIDQHRKSDILVTVQDDNGVLISGANVTVKMKKHAYKFGSAVVASRIMGSGTDNDRYNEIIENYFNRVVMENDLKWARWENMNNRFTTLDALDFLNDSGIEVRGHCLVWPSWNHMPNDLEQHKNDAAYLSKRVTDHIEEEVTETAGLLVDWDVINEPYWNHDLMDILGDEVMVEWYKLAHANDPAANLYLNDNNIISAAGLDQKHQNHFYETVEYLLSNGAPLHGLGTQCHFGSNVTPPTRIWEILDKLASYGLEVQATEFDVNTNDRDLQVAYTRDFMTAYFAHPATVGILMWGFWAGSHWKPEAALWDREWNLRPHGEKWIELVTETWWTDATLNTDATGQASVRGFHGDYYLEINVDGTKTTTDFSHAAGGTKILVKGESVTVEHGKPAEVRTGTNYRPRLPQLAPNYPNPFNSQTQLKYSLPKASNISLVVYNSRGQVVRQMLEQRQPAGEYAIAWDGRNDNGMTVSSGVYFCHLKTDNFSTVRKMLFIQ